MITEWLIAVGSGFAKFIVTLFPTLSLPSGLVNVDDSVRGVIEMAAGTGVFVDWTYIGLVAGIPLAIWAGGLLLKGTRALIAHLPFVGGRG